jgi:hypothetical protein
MSNERFLIVFSQNGAVNMDSSTHLTFAAAWEQLNKLYTEMGAGVGSCFKRTYATADACLRSNFDGRNSWEFGHYVFPISQEVDPHKKAFIMRVEI